MAAGAARVLNEQWEAVGTALARKRGAKTDMKQSSNITMLNETKSVGRARPADQVFPVGRRGLRHPGPRNEHLGFMWPGKLPT
eukprot:9486741-Pyramimonas_sp.AAC.1